MISAHGNRNSGNSKKTLAAGAGLFLTPAGLLFGGLLSEKRAKIRFYEKKYETVISSLEADNQNLKNEIH